MTPSAPPRTLADVLAGLDDPEHGFTFVESEARRFVSFADLDRLTADLAERWSGLGLRRGERVVTVVADNYEFVLGFLSALRAGLVGVPMFPPVTFGRVEAYGAALERLCRAGDARACLGNDATADLIAAAVPDDCRALTFDGLCSAERAAVSGPDPDDPAFVQFSSGSTGSPKGAVVTHRSLLANLASIHASVKLDPDRDRTVSWLPMYHDMGLIGMMLVPLAAQVPSWYLTPFAFARRPADWLTLITEVRGTFGYAPNFAYSLMHRRVGDPQLSALDLGSWRIAGCGAEPIRADTLRAFAERFAPAGFDPLALAPSYGLAENTLAVTLTPPGVGLRTLVVDAEALERDGVAVAAKPDAGDARTSEWVSCGPPICDVRVEVLDAAGAPLPPDCEGEIVVGGDSLAQGYLFDPETTAAAWRSGWLHTGDKGFLHEGELFVTGRIKDLIIVHGRNVHPQQIEAIAAEVPALRGGAVVALADAAEDTAGVVLVCEAARPSPKETERIVHEVRAAVYGGFGVNVSEVVLLPRGGIPKTTSGKLRRAMTAQLLAERQKPAES